MENPFRKAVDEAMNLRGHATILIAGRSGAGKSTLINAVFSGNFAETGQGRPVTRSAKEYTKPESPISLIDSRGLELAAYQTTVRELTAFIRERKRDADPGRHVHCAWLCIAEDSRRVEDGEIQLCEQLADLEVPVIGVITKHRADQGFRSKVQELLPRARNVVSVRAIREKFDDDDLVLPPKGLKELIDLTLDVVPEAQRKAVAAAQKVSLDAKVKQARAIVAGAATAAAGAVAVPVPAPDAVFLIPIQVGMLAGISAAFGLSVDEAMLSTIAAGVLGGGAAVIVGRELAKVILKLVPGGNVVNAGVAVTVTTGLGEAYVQAVAKLLVDRDPSDVSAVEVRKALQEALLPAG